MKKLSIAVASLLVAALTGCASNSSVEKNAMSLKTMEEHLTHMDMRVKKLEEEEIERVELDRTKFCFANDMAFSEGATNNGRTCKREHGMTVVHDGKRVIPALSWQ